MDWLGNIGKGIKDFVSWVNPFDDDDDEKRRREREAKRSATKPQKPTTQVGINNQQKNPLTVNTLQDSLKPKNNNPFNLDFTQNDTKINDLTTQVNGQTVAKAPKPKLNANPPTVKVLGNTYTRQQDGNYKNKSGQVRSAEMIDNFRKIEANDQDRKSKRKKDDFWGTVGDIASAPSKVLVEAPANFFESVLKETAGLAEDVVSGKQQQSQARSRAEDNQSNILFANEDFVKSKKDAIAEALQSGRIDSGRAEDLLKELDSNVESATNVAEHSEEIWGQSIPTDSELGGKFLLLGSELWLGGGKAFASLAKAGRDKLVPAMTRFAEEKLGRKLTKDELKDVSTKATEFEKEAAKGTSAVEDTKSYAPLDEATTAKTNELKAKSDETPKSDNTVRLYQMTENGVPSPNYFDNIEQLANYANGRSKNADLRFVDVPEEQAVKVAGKKGEAGVYEIKEPELKESLAKNKSEVQAEAKAAEELVSEQKAQQAEQNSVKQGGGLSYNDMMDRIQQRREEYKANPEGTTRAAANERQAANPNSAEAIAADAQAAGLTQADINTFITQYGMTRGELRAILNASNNLAGAKNPAGLAVSVLRDIRSKGVHGQTKAALNNNVTEQRLAKEAEEATPTKETAGGTVIDTPAGKTDTETGEIIDDIPELTAASPLQEAIAKATAIVEDLDESVRKLGLDPEDLRRKKQAANRGEYEMTDIEQAASVIHTQRLNEARQVLADSGLEFDGSQLHYTPQVRQGEAGLPATREELTNFGYANQRKNAIPLEELDYSNLAEIDYIVKAENKDLVIADSIQRAAEVDGRPVTPESVQIATKQTMDLQNKIADAKGSEKVINNDTVSDLNQIGKNEGYAQEVNTVKAGAVSQEPREMLTRAGVYDRGFVQYDNSAGYANEFTNQVIDNNIPSSQLGDALTQSIRKAMPNAEQSTVTEAVQGAMRRIQNRKLEGQDIMPQVMSAFRSVSKAEMFRLGKTTDFADKKMKAVVNEQMNARLLQDNYSKDFAQELDSFIAQRINASLRGMNVVSAGFELGDVANILSNYGVKNIKDAKFGFGKVDDDFLGMSKRYGEADPHFLSTDLPQVSKLNEVWSDDSTSFLQKIKRSYETGENKLLIFRYVEQYKTELFFRQADNYWRSQGLQGTDLVNQVQKDYLDTMLPNKIITANRLLGKLPKSLTQYLNWSVQATKRLGRTVGGGNEAGVYRDMSRGSRIARGVSTELAPKIAVAAVLGVPIQQILGMRDWTGATDGDFSGIPEEEKNTLDRVMSYVGMSPTLGVASNLYYAYRRNEIAGTDDDDRTEQNPNWLGDALVDETTKLIPFYTQLNKTLGVQDAVNQGYFENRDGRVQFDAPEAGSLSHLLGLVTGKTYMRENRDYGDNPDLISVLQGKAGLGDLLTHNQTVDNLMQTLGFDTARSYERPVSDNDFKVGRDKDGNLVEFNYNEWVKQQYKEGHDKGGEVLAQAKEYNEALDNLRYQNPDVYEAYLDIMDDKDLVSPERWSALTGTNSEGGFDLTLVRMMGDRKKAVAQAAADSLGNPEYANNYDPMYNLDDDQLRSVLQQKSTATGDDIALRNVLYKSEWYQEYMAESSKYYDQQLFGDEDFGNTERVKEWNDYNTSLSQLSYMQPSKYDSEEVLEQKAALREQFPYNSAYQAAKSEYEEKTGKDFYGSEESTQWYAQYGDGKKAEDAQLDAAKLALINQMREIEGHPPMSEESYAQATEIANTSGSSGGGSGGGKRGGGSYEPLPNISNDFTWQSISDALKPSKVRAFKPNTSVGRRTNRKIKMGAKARGGDTYTV